MSSAAPSRPVPISQVWSGEKVLAEDLMGEDLAEVLHLHSRASAWWVIQRGPEHHDELLRLADDVGLDELAVADLAGSDRKAAYEEFDNNTTMVIMHAVDVDRATTELTTRSASMVMTPQVVVCLADPDVPRGGFSPAAVLAGAQKELAAHQIDGAAEVMVGAVIGSYEDAVDWLEDEGEKLSDVIFTGRPLTKDEQLHVFRLRSTVSHLRRLAGATAKMLAGLSESQRRDPAESRRWSKIVERHQRVMHSVDAAAESLASVFDTSTALSDERANAIMKMLTAWAAIIAVPTLVTGFVGMNVSFPLDGTSTGFWVYLVIMIVPVIILYSIFKKKDWL